MGFSRKALAAVRVQLEELSEEECGLGHHLFYLSDPDQTTQTECPPKKRFGLLGCLHNGGAVLSSCVSDLRKLGVLTPEAADTYRDRLNKIFCAHGTSALAADWQHLNMVEGTGPEVTEAELLDKGKEMQRPTIRLRAEIKLELLGLVNEALITATDDEVHAAFPMTLELVR